MPSPAGGSDLTVPGSAPSGANLGRPMGQSTTELTNAPPGVQGGSSPGTRRVTKGSGSNPQGTASTGQRVAAGTETGSRAAGSASKGAPFASDRTTTGLSPGGEADDTPGAPADESGTPRVRPFLGEQGGKRAPAPQRVPDRIYGNRDWLILIECTADSLVISPGGKRILNADLVASKVDNVLFTTVQQMIARRQAMVRPGEPAYRPMIRFLVRPDGLRSYYLAFPALETLQVPMTRENAPKVDAKN